MRCRIMTRPMRLMDGPLQRLTALRTEQWPGSLDRKA